MGNDIVKLARARAVTLPSSSCVKVEDVRALQGYQDLVPIESKVADGKGKTLDEHRQLLQVRDEFVLDPVVGGGIARLLGDPIVVNSKRDLLPAGNITAGLAKAPEMGVEISGTVPSGNYLPAFTVSRKGSEIIYLVGTVKASNLPVGEPPVPQEFKVRLPIPAGNIGGTLTAKVLDSSGKVLFQGSLPSIQTFRLTSSPVRFRLDAHGDVSFSTQDLTTEKSNQMAISDPNRDGWVSRDEYFEVADQELKPLIREAHTVAGQSVIALREQMSRGQNHPIVAPPSVAIDTQPGTLPRREEFIPLANYLASRFAQGTPFDEAPSGFSMPGGGPEVVFFSADDVFQKYSLREIECACAILTEREGGEFMASRKQSGEYFLTKGNIGACPIREDLNGLNHVFHTHPHVDPSRSGPSPGDIEFTKFDPDRSGEVINQNGWHTSFSVDANGKLVVQQPVRLWRDG